MFDNFVTNLCCHFFFGLNRVNSFNFFLLHKPFSMLIVFFSSINNEYYITIHAFIGITFLKYFCFCQVYWRLLFNRKKYNLSFSAYLAIDLLGFSHHFHICRLSNVSHFVKAQSFCTKKNRPFQLTLK